MIKYTPTDLKKLNGEKSRAAAEKAALENALCELESMISERFAALEDALCEIDAGGNDNE